MIIGRYKKVQKYLLLIQYNIEYEI